MDNEKYNYYRETRFWPLADELNYERWLDNFENDEEQEIARRILDFFIYIPDRFINQMLATVIGKCGYYFKQMRGTWTDNDFKTNCWYSFIPGEEQKPTDSGYVFNRKLRDKLHIPEDNLLNYIELHEKLARYTNRNVILVDDFVGSGHQTCVAWNRRIDKTKKSLQELTIENSHCVVYAPLIVNQMGFDNITKDCPNLGIVFIHLLNPQYSLFDKECPCWDGDNKLYLKAMDILKDKSIKLGIPFTGGIKTIDYKGYKEQGLALAFEHGIPDACPPIFYWETEYWKPLIKKVYSRF